MQFASLKLLKYDLVNQIKLIQSLSTLIYYMYKTNIDYIHPEFPTPPLANWSSFDIASESFIYRRLYPTPQRSAETL